MSQVQKKRIGFLLAPIVTITACTIAFLYYSGVEAAPPGTGPSMEDEAPSFGVRRISPSGPVAPPPEYLLPLMIGPVPGLTTAWYEAPTSVPVPLGTTLEFKLTGLLPATQVIWSGAVAVERGDTFSRAEYIPGTAGPQSVQVVVNPGTATQSVLSSQLNVIDAPNLTCTVTVSVPPLLLDENSTNTETMAYFFSSDSIAQLTTVGPNHYRTSVDRRLTFAAQTQPTGFESMVEWRSGGAVLGLGQTLADQIITSPGSTIFEVGPVAAPEQVRIDAYSVTITSHVTHEDSVIEGVPTTFTAVTDPPGYEADITWLSSTKYGSGSPVLGTGPSFTAQFDEIWGPSPNDPNIPFLWLGVRADNARFIQDCVERFPEEAGFIAMQGNCQGQVDFFGVTGGLVDVDIPIAVVCVQRGAPMGVAGEPRSVDLDFLVRVGNAFIPGVGAIQIEMAVGIQPGSVVADTADCDFPATMTVAVQKRYITPIGTFTGGTETYVAEGIAEFPPFGAILVPPPGTEEVPLFNEDGEQVGIFIPSFLTPDFLIDPDEFPGGCPPAP